jgi:hypothetical protein
MPSEQLNITQIPALRVPIIDPRTGLISREWYLFFFSLFNLAGAGSNPISLTDLQVGPADSILSTQQTLVDSALQALGVTPNEPGWSSAQASVENALQALNVAPGGPNWSSAQASVENALQALGVTPPSAEWLSQQMSVFNGLDALAVAPAYTPQVPDTRYGVFSDTTTQTAAAINTAYAVTFNTTDLSNGVYIGSPTSRVYVDRLGIYNFQFSAQLDQSSASAHDVYIWADINGTTQPNTGTKVTLVGNNAATVAAWNFVFRLNAGDYFRLMWSTSNTACQISAAAAVPPVPAIPSVILSVTDNIGITR